MPPQPSTPSTLWWAIAAVALFFYGTTFLPFDLITIVSLLAIILFTWAAFRTPLDRVLPETAAGLLLLVYIAYPLTLIPRLLKEENGTALLLFLFLCVWSGDIAALYIGKRFGKRKLAPTSLAQQDLGRCHRFGRRQRCLWHGTRFCAGQYLTRSGSSFTRLHTSEPWWQSLLLAILLNVAAQFGDLLESALKRGANIKDSGSILPGHGGILDRIERSAARDAPVLSLYITHKANFSLSIF